MQKTKKCSKCGKIKKLSEFYKDKYKKSGYVSACKLCRNPLHKKWKENNIEKYRLSSRKSTLKTLFGMTIEDYDQMYNNQKGCCAICRTHQSEFKKRLSIDHRHSDGKVRALLCNSCNQMLGHSKEDINILHKAIDYLVKHE